jgi:molybdopterin-guanine dinucleotide biosynthesis protein A
MGTDKTVLELGGRSMLEHAAAALAASAVVDRVVVAGPPAKGLEAVADVPGVSGPASGLLAAFRAFPGHDVLLVAADQPWVAAGTLRRLVAETGAAVVPVDGRRQVTCAVYRSACHPELERLAAAGDPSLQRLLDAVDVTEVAEETWRSWGEDGRSWRSVDTPEDLARARVAWPGPVSIR